MSQGNKRNHPLGLRKQFCKKGHNVVICGRDKNNTCISCRNITNVEYRNKHREDISINGKKYYSLNKESSLQKRKQYYIKNSSIIKKRVRRYQEEHPEIHRLSSLRLHSKRSLRISKFGQNTIKAFYKQCPIGMEVDHIVPLLGKKVSGLHVIWNLQYLTKSENSKKYNKIDLLQASIQYGKILEQAGLK